MDRTKTIIIFFFLLFSFSCDTFRSDELSNYEEMPKLLEGSWQLKSVSRNEIDITSTMNFSQFILHLNADGSYTMDNYLPFAVKADGEWEVDDPYYPFHLIFKENGSDNEVNLELTYPIVKGERILSVKLSPGCNKNEYIYVFEQY